MLSLFSTGRVFCHRRVDLFREESKRNLQDPPVSGWLPAAAAVSGHSCAPLLLEITPDQIQP